MSEFPVATTPAPGVMAVDWEQRVDFERLRQYRLERTRRQMEEDDIGALLLFETSNIRYVTSTQIGYWAFNKGERWALLTRNGRPRIWDFGSAAKAHRLQLPHMYDTENSVGGNTGLQGAIGPEAGLHARAAKEIAAVLRDEGLENERLGVDMAETAVFLALQKEGLNVVDGQQTMMKGEIKNPMRSSSCPRRRRWSTASTRHLRGPEARRPESDIVALPTPGSSRWARVREAINSIAGERCSPHPHVFSDRMIRPGDQAYFDIIHAYNGYRTCYYRTFVVGRATQAQRDAFKQAREWMDAAIELVRPGNTTDMIAKVWPEAHEFGFQDEMDAFGLQFGHGVGVGLHERPIISRLNSLDDPIEIKEGCTSPSRRTPRQGRAVGGGSRDDGGDEDGPQVTLFPCEELMVANEY